VGHLRNLCIVKFVPALVRALVKPVVSSERDCCLDCNVTTKDCRVAVIAGPEIYRHGRIYSMQLQTSHSKSVCESLVEATGLVEKRSSSVLAPATLSNRLA
jgi:hypothetical protein